MYNLNFKTKTTTKHRGTFWIGTSDVMKTRDLNNRAEIWLIFKDNRCIKKIKSVVNKKFWQFISLFL